MAARDSAFECFYSQLKYSGCYIMVFFTGLAVAQEEQVTY